MGNYLHRLSMAFLWLGLSACPNEPPPPEPNVIQLTAGALHTCALLDTGDVKCWGDNTGGQLGVGNTTSIGDNEAVSSGSSVGLGGKATQIESKGNFTCALLDTGSVRCWGRNINGNLGYGNTDAVGDDETPADAGDIEIGGKATQIAVGNSHACALLDTGNVRCWGRNLGGSLGYGNTEDIGDDETPASAGDVELGQPATQIAAGTNATCALFENGGVRCWGNRITLGQSTGDILNPNIGDNETPVALQDIELGAKATQVSVGRIHACAVLEGGDVRCWGVGLQGALGVVGQLQIGVGNPPNQFDDAIDLGGKAAHIEAGGDHTCALLDTGDVKCWGNAERGQLGLGNDNNTGFEVPPSSTAPINLGGKVIQLTSGSQHNCALLEDHAVRCWGNNDSGQTGTGDANHIGDDETPASASDVDLGAGTVSQLACGWNYTCVLLDTGAARCWGDTNLGQNGYGLNEDTGDNELPASIGDLPLGGNAVQLSTRDFQACALLDTGAVRCWGANNQGVLGYGDIGIIGDDETPAEVGDIDLGGAATQVALGGNHACALMDTGAVRCWGDGFFGALGYGNTDNIGDDETPGAGGDVDLGGNAAELVAGDGFTCALMDTGNVRCWGDGFSGGLGYGNTNTIGDDETPASAGDIDLGGTAVQLVAGDFHACAILDAGNVRCWGDNGFGQLGYGVFGNIGDDETPASAGDVPLGGKAVQLSAHELTTCALLDTGAVRCWGAALFGALGYPGFSFIGDDETPADMGDIDLGGIAVQISAGVFHTCALLDTGAVRCWGANSDGELGYGNDSDIGDSESPADSSVELF